MALGTNPEMNPGENECQGNGEALNVRCCSREEKSSSRTAPVEQSFGFLARELERENNSSKKRSSDTLRFGVCVTSVLLLLFSLVPKELQELPQQ